MYSCLIFWHLGGLLGSAQHRYLRLTLEYTIIRVNQGYPMGRCKIIKNLSQQGSERVPLSLDRAGGQAGDEAG